MTDRTFGCVSPELVCLCLKLLKNPRKTISECLRSLENLVKVQTF